MLQEGFTTPDNVSFSIRPGVFLAGGRDET
jgi:hypothetical protein